jgi:hypothetical protein
MWVLNVAGDGHTRAASKASKVLNVAGDGHTGAAAARRRCSKRDGTPHSRLHAGTLLALLVLVQEYLFYCCREATLLETRCFVELLTLASMLVLYLTEP